MLKLSICTDARIFTILLLVVAVTKTEKYNIHTVDFPMCYHYLRNYCDYQYCEPLKNTNCIFSNVTHVLRDFISAFLNGTCVYDSLSLNTRCGAGNSNTIDDSKRFHKLLKNILKCIPTHSQRKLIPSIWTNTFNDYVNDIVVFNDTLKRSVTETRKNKRNRIGYSWKRRTLCAVADKQKYSSESLEKKNGFSDTDITQTGERKTLMDYDESDFMNDIDDPDSLKPHVRVKRSKLAPDSVSGFIYQQDYLKDLANSFPQNTYDSVDENAYDDDASIDTKRETKSQEFLVKDEQFNESPKERIQSKALNVDPLTVSVHLLNNDDKSAETDFISAPSDAIQGHTVMKNNLKFGGQTENQCISALQRKSDVPIVSQRSYENVQEQNLPEDPMLAVELVRKKRNDALLKARNERGLKINTLPDFQSVIDQNKKSSDDEKRSVFEPEKSEGHLNPSSSIGANLKADLLRIRRKAKEKRRRKNSKLQKKKKHAGKKNNVRRNFQRSAKDVRQKNTARLRVARDRKKNEARKEGKSKVGIARLVSKKNNGNNFRRRSEKAKKSNERAHSAKERSPKNVASTRHGKVRKRGTENKIDTANSKVSLVHQRWTAENDDFKAGTNQYVNAPKTQNGKYESFVEDERSVDDPTLRSKRAKVSNHGFPSKEDELRYYENIREPGSESDQHTNYGEDQFSVVNKMDGNRAVRSIEEVKELAKKLVTKVNELQNYLNVEEATKNDQLGKKIETRAIDDLCSNVSTACDAFKEAPNKIVQKCVPSTNHDDSVAKIVKKNVDSLGITDERKYIKNDKNSGEKRSIGSRVVKISPSSPKRIRKEDEPKSNHKWGKWTDWSSCSVTCGKGRQIRWRYCLRDCSTAETEMEEKACQLPACPPGKFLGIF